MKMKRFVENNKNQVITEDLIENLSNRSLPFKTLMAYYNCAMMEVETKFRVLNEQFSLMYDRNPIESIKTRLKSPESIIKKLANREFPLSVDGIEENLNDVAGIRIICSFVDDIYMLAECILNQDDVTLVERKDYIKTPKPNGYRSLHLIIEIPIFLQEGKKNMKVEIQLRTIAMDFWASLEHKISYKKDVPAEIRDELAKELLSCANKSAELDMRMEQIRKHINDI